MNHSLADAFAKSGLVSQKKADKVKRAAKAEKASKESDEKLQKTQRPPQRIESIHLDEDSQVIEELWTNDRSHKFVVHLIFSFIPYTKAEKIWSYTDEQAEKERKCCFCSNEILTVNEAAQIAGDTAGDNLLKRVRFELDNKDRYDDPEFQKEHQQFMQDLMQDTFGSRKLGMCCEASKKVICMPCYDVFYNWVMTHMLRGDREIHGIIRKLRSESVSTRV